MGGKAPNDQLVIDPSRWHNEENDDEEKNQDIEKEGDVGRSQNVMFYEILLNNWPRVFAVATRNIEPGQELLGDYGDGFCNNFRLMMKRQHQLTEIKERVRKEVRKEVNDEWQAKYDKLQSEFDKLKQKNDEQ